MSLSIGINSNSCIRFFLSLLCWDYFPFVSTRDFNCWLECFNDNCPGILFLLFVLPWCWRLLIFFLLDLSSLRLCMTELLDCSPDILRTVLWHSDLDLLEMVVICRSRIHSPAHLQALRTKCQLNFQEHYNVILICSTVRKPYADLKLKQWY